MRQFLLLTSLSFILIGCQTFWTRLNDEHAQTHKIEIQVDEKGRKSLKYVDASHRLKEGKVYLVLSGSVQKPSGTFSTLLTVNAKFMNNKGEAIVEENDRVHLRVTGGHASRRYGGSFFITIPDNPDIVKCEVVSK